MRRGPGTATVEVRLSGPLPAPDRDDVTAEAYRLLAFLAPGEEHDVRVGAEVGTPDPRV